MKYIFIWYNTCNLFSMQGQSRATSNNSHGSPSPSPHQSSRPPRRWSSLSLVVIVRFVWETCPGLMFVKKLCLRVGNTYVGEAWYEQKHVCEKFVRFVVLWNMWSLLCMWWLCDICDVYVMIMWYIFCLFERNIKTNKKGAFWSLCRV
jgi:hypothetical protein